MLYATGDVPNAIRQLQTAKHSWYGSGRLEPTVDCLFDLADWYLELGLPLAAKYNAQTACGLLLTPAGRNEMGLLGDALQRVMMCDFRQGAWLKVADMVAPFLGARLSSQSSNESRQDALEVTGSLLGVILHGARLRSP